MSHFHSGEQRLQDSLQKLGQQNCPSLEWMRKCGIFLQAHVRRHRKAKCHYLVRHSKHLDASCFPFGFAMLKALQAAESGSLAYCFDDASPDAFPRLWRVSRLGDTPTSAWRVEWERLARAENAMRAANKAMWYDAMCLTEGFECFEEWIHVVFFPKEFMHRSFTGLLVEQFLCCIPKNFKGSKV